MTAAEVQAGQYVGIFISDTGVGMTPDTARTGIRPVLHDEGGGARHRPGASPRVYGFVKQSGGHVKIYSEVGAGTTVKIYLPRLYSTETADELRTATVAVPRGNHEIILLVEDDPDVRSFTIGLMQELDYQVLDAPDAATALRLLDGRPDVRAAVHRCWIAGGDEWPAVGRRSAPQTTGAEGAGHQRIREERHRPSRTARSWRPVDHEACTPIPAWRQSSDRSWTPTRCYGAGDEEMAPSSR